MENNTDFREFAEELWGLLDDLDTFSDIIKPTIDNPESLVKYYKTALAIAGKRFNYFDSDGYKLYTHQEFKELNSKTVL